MVFRHGGEGAVFPKGLGAGGWLCTRRAAGRALPPHAHAKPAARDMVVYARPGCRAAFALPVMRLAAGRQLRLVSCVPDGRPDGAGTAYRSGRAGAGVAAGDAPRGDQPPAPPAAAAVLPAFAAAGRRSRVPSGCRGDRAGPVVAGFCQPALCGFARPAGPVQPAAAAVAAAQGYAGCGEAAGPPCGIAGQGRRPVWADAGVCRAADVPARAGDAACALCGRAAVCDPADADGGGRRLPSAGTIRRRTRRRAAGMGKPARPALHRICGAGGRDPARWGGGERHAVSPLLPACRSMAGGAPVRGTLSL